MYTDLACCITHRYTEVPLSVMSLRLPDEMADTLANLAKATGRSKSFLVIDACEWRYPESFKQHL